jgi:hypothetical protein
MRCFRGGARVVGAFRAVPDVVDEGAVAMLQTGCALPALDGHSPLIALRTDKAWLPRLAQLFVFAQAAHPSCLSSRKRLIPAVCLRASGSSPPKFVEPLVIDPEMVRNLVDHRDRHLVDHIRLAVAEIQQGPAVDRDGVRQ